MELDTLEQCEKGGGEWTCSLPSYYYEHADGKGNRSICYSNALPEDRIFNLNRKARTASK